MSGKAPIINILYLEVEGPFENLRKNLKKGAPPRATTYLSKVGFSSKVWAITKLLFFLDFAL